MDSNNLISLYSPKFCETWTKVNLYKQATWKNGFAFKQKHFSQKGKPIIKIVELKRGITNQTGRTLEVLDEAYYLKQGDMLFTWSGSPDTSINTFWYLFEEEGWLNQHIFKITPNSDINSIFFFYVMKYINPNFISIAKNKQTTGLGHVTVADIKNFTISIPNLYIQKKIAHILSTLDDKIELNLKMNQTLEEMAQSLFKSLFVDFDPVHAKANASSNADYDQIAKELGISREVLDLFPDEIEESELGMIPKGWDISIIGNSFELLGGFAFKSTSYDKTGEFGLATIKNVQNGNFVEECTNHISKIPEKMKKYCRLESGDILLSLTGNVGRVCIVPKGKYLLNQRVSKIIARKNTPYSLCYFYFRSPQVFKEMISIAKGTAQLNLSPIEISKLIMIEPDKTLLANVGYIFDNFYSKLIANNNQIQALKKTRNILLPKLLSGKLDVSELDIGHVDH